MPLEHLGRDPKLNIKGIETPDSKKEEFEFDLRKEVTPEVWEGFKQCIESKEFEPQLPLGYLAQLFPERRDELAGYVNLRAQKKNISGYMKASRSCDAMIEVFALLTIFPGESRKSLGITRAMVERFFSVVKLRGNGENNIFYIQALLIIAPELKQRLLDDMDLRALKGMLLEKRPFTAETLLVLAQLRLIEPELFTRDELASLDLSHLKEIPRYIKSGGVNYRQYLNQLFALQCFTSDKVELGPHGAIFRDDPRQDFRPTTPPLPELKKS